MKILVVGAGLAGAVCARELSSAGHTVEVIDQRSHVGGNCHTQRDEETGIMEHVYGPHIFNTNLDHVWRYVHRFASWEPYINRVKAEASRGIYSLPINLHTINQFFGKTMTPTEAKDFLYRVSKKPAHGYQPLNFEEQAELMLGSELYREFFYHYTKRQWGCEPRKLPASILTRLPVRFNYNDNYYNSKYQAIPRRGYTDFISNILLGITVHLNTPWDPDLERKYNFVIFTGPIDQYFNYAYGHLGYRTVFWEKLYGKGDMQGTAVINNCTEHLNHTRIHEHKHFAPWETHERSMLLFEYSKETQVELGDIPFYPKRLQEDKTKLEAYERIAKELPNIAFCGRLGTYSYMNMDLVIDQALTLSKNLLLKFDGRI